MLTTLLNKNSEIYASSLAKVVDCTYSHVVKILQEMQKAGLVAFEKQGRLKVLTLTKKGEEVAKHIDNIKNSL
jgi:predicted transcriptional regulator